MSTEGRNKIMAKWLEKEVVSTIDGIPPVEEWQSARCSACGKYHTTPYMYYFDEYAYCPNCGQAMDGKDEPLDKDTNVRSKDEPQAWTKENCKGCRYNEYPYDSGTCFVRVCINGNKYEPKDEPQADCQWK